MISRFKGMVSLGELIVATLPADAAVDESMLPEYPFLCAIVLMREWDAKWLRTVLYTLLVKGAVYFVFHGVRCEEAHDLADSVRDIFYLPGGEDVVMTTWHHSQPLVDTLWYLAYSAIPTEGYCSDQKRYVVLEIADADKSSILDPVREVFP